MAKSLKKRNNRKAYGKKCIKDKAKKIENDELNRFFSSGDILVTCLRLVLAKVKEDARKGNLLLKKNDLFKSKGNNFPNDNTNSSVSFSLNKDMNALHSNSFNENESNNDIIINNDINNNDKENYNEHELSDINGNSLNFDEASFEPLFSQNIF